VSLYHKAAEAQAMMDDAAIQRFRKKPRSRIKWVCKRCGYPLPNNDRHAPCDQCGVHKPKALKS